MPISKKLLDKINDIKSTFCIDIASYPDVAYKICELLETEREINNDFRTFIEQFFRFLQEKCKEEDYISEPFFQKLLRLHEIYAKSIKIK